MLREFVVDVSKDENIGKNRWFIVEISGVDDARSEKGNRKIDQRIFWENR